MRHFRRNMKYGYARVSTKKQNKSLDDQIYRLKKLDCDVIFQRLLVVLVPRDQNCQSF